MDSIRPLAVTLTALWLVMAAAPVAAQEPATPPYSRYYTGSFVAAGAAAGASFFNPSRGPSSWSPTVGAWVQATSPLQIIDVRLGWRGSSFSMADGDVRQDSVSLVAGAHPFFLLHLESSPLYYALGSIALLVGADAEHVSPDNRTRGEAVQVGLQLGGSADIPLDDVDDGSSWWLGLGYHRNSFKVGPSPYESIEVIQHTLALTLSYRHNGLVYAF